MHFLYFIIQEYERPINIKTGETIYTVGLIFNTPKSVSPTINSMEENPCWNAANYSAGQEGHRIFWNLKVLVILNHTLGHTNPVHDSKV
jgi:hypothetical protein